MPGIDLNIGKKAHKRLAQKANEEGYESISEYIKDNLVDSLLGNDEPKDVTPTEEFTLTTEDLCGFIAMNEFEDEEINALFFVLADKMDNKDRLAASKILANYKQFIRGLSKREGIHESPPEVSEKPLPKPDPEGVSQDLAEEVVNNQGVDFEKIAEKHEEEMLKKKVEIQPEEEKSEAVTEEALEEDEEWEEYDDDDDDDEYEYEEEGGQVVSQASPEEVRMYSKKEDSNETLSEEPRGHVSSAADDPDDDMPDWDDDPVDEEEKATGINSYESEKVIEEAPGSIVANKLKKPVELKYDPNSPKVKNRGVPKGQYGHLPRTNSSAEQNDMIHGVHLLKNLGVDRGEIMRVLQED